MERRIGSSDLADAITTREEKEREAARAQQAKPIQASEGEKTPSLQTMADESQRRKLRHAALREARKKARDRHRGV